MPRFSLSLEGDPARELADTLKQVTEAALAGVSEAAGELQTALRDQVVSAGLGQRLAGSWTTRTSQPDETTVSAEVASSASLILSAFDQGVTITARNRRWLAIPTAAVPRGLRRKHLTPAELETRLGRRLRFLQPPGRKYAVLVLDGTVLFVLTPQVTLRKRLDIARAAAAIETELPDLIQDKIEEQD